MYTEAKYNKAEEFLDKYGYDTAKVADGIKESVKKETAKEEPKEQLVKSKQRVKDAGEVFTPRWVVRDMLDLDEIKDMSFELDTTFLEPACGNGNFIIQILVRKLMSVSAEAFDIDVARSVASIYGVDIAEDNVKETRARMMNAIKHFYADNGMELRREIECSLWYILYRNIILGNTLEYKKYAENYSDAELVESKSYTNERIARRERNSERGIAIVDTRANDAAFGADDLTVSEWKFMEDGVHRSEFRVADMAHGQDAEAVTEYAVVCFEELHNVKDIKLDPINYI